MKNQTQSTKTLIIEALGNTFPLTLKQIYTEVKKNKSISYQGVHKVVKELVNEEIVDKVEKQHFLNRDWLKNQMNSFSKYYSYYFDESHDFNKRYITNEIQLFRFSTQKELLDFVIEAYAKGLVKSDNNEIYFTLGRLHPLIPPSVIQLLKRLKKDNQIYMLCKEDRFADRWAAKLYRSLGVKVKTGVDIPMHNSVCVGDTVLQYFFFFNESYVKSVHMFSDKFRDKSQMKLLKLTSDIFYKKAKIYLMVTKYYLFVKEIKKAVEKEFKK